MSAKGVPVCTNILPEGATRIPAPCQLRHCMHGAAALTKYHWGQARNQGEPRQLSPPICELVQLRLSSRLLRDEPQKLFMPSCQIKALAPPGLEWMPHVAVLFGIKLYKK